MQSYKIIHLLAVLFLALSCTGSPEPRQRMEYASFFSVTEDGCPVVISPYNGQADTLAPATRIICMSSSYVGFLDAIGASGTVVGVSGLDYLLNPSRNAAEVGYDPALDYETIVSLKPDILLTYTVSSTEPASFAKLRELGIPVAVVSEHLESHPLARAEYVKFFGALTGHTHEADSVFAAVRDRYNALIQKPSGVKVLANIPYAEQWYIPGGDNYMARLITDAGGEVLGSVPGRRESSVIGLEKAWEYGKQADVWLGTGWCKSLKDLHSANPLFEDFPVAGRAVWNTGDGFWETGPVRPDLLLEDLIGIFNGSDGLWNYYYRLE